MNNIISIQEFLRPALPQVLGCKDYADEEQLLNRVDRILSISGLENLFLKMSMEQFEANGLKMAAAGETVLAGPKAIERYQRHSRKALRCTVLQEILQVDGYRKMSKCLANSPLYRWFCKIEEFCPIRVPGKSTLHDYAHWLPEDKMASLLDTFAASMRNENLAQMIGLKKELEMSALWVDSTCLKANIHFPVDWLLLRDAVRTLVANILTIRSHGLVHRIIEPETFLRQINALSMAMTSRSNQEIEGKKNPKKARKKIFRQMKSLCGVVMKHAVRYRKMLDESWSETDLTRPQAEVILRGMDNVIEQLPEAQRQAHERIIGERLVPSKDKILSLYESDIHVVVRGKAGAAVEFGNTLFLCETSDGFILHHELLKDCTNGDSKWLEKHYQVLKEKSGGTLCGVVGDRGFESEANSRMLDEDDMFNGLCPRNSQKLADRLENDEVFAVGLKRRGQTEGRVGIIKNMFLGGTPRAKVFKNRQLQVAWAVLAHNLWVVARLPWVEEKQAVAEAA